MHKCVDIGGGLIAYVLSTVATDHEKEYLRGRPIIIDHKYVHCGHEFLASDGSESVNSSRRNGNAKSTNDRFF